MKERVVVVTGGAQGIGYAIAKKFAEAGDFVAIADLNEEKAMQAARRLGDSARGFRLDITDSSAISAFVKELIEEKGQIDVLVNNAGLQHRDKIEDFPEEKWRQLIDVLLTGPFLMTKAVLPFMKERRNGRIINISSVHGEVATPEKSAYVSAKHGLLGFTKTAAIETATHGITVNAVLPGPVATDLLMRQIHGLMNEHRLSEEEALAAVMYPRQPMQRFIQPEEIANTVFFLASEGAGAITGEKISVSGGM